MHKYVLVFISRKMFGGFKSVSTGNEFGTDNTLDTVIDLNGVIFRT